MENINTILNSIIIILLTIILLLSKYLALKKREEKYFLELSKKFSEAKSIKELSYKLADEINKLLSNSYTVIAKYTQEDVQILCNIPQLDTIPKLVMSREYFLILKNLYFKNLDFIDRDDIQSEHYKEIFPLYDYENFYIFPILNNENDFLTLEIYGKNKNYICKKEEIIKIIIQEFKYNYLKIKEMSFARKKITESESIIKILDKIHNSLNEKNIESLILEEFSKTLNADRGYFLIISKKHTDIPILADEYLASPYIKSLKSSEFETKKVWEELQKQKNFPEIFTIDSSEKFIKHNNLENTILENFLIKSQIKSSYPFLIYEDDENKMYFVAQYINKTNILNKQELETMTLLTQQAQMAITQAKLYSDKENLLYKESLENQLRKEIVHIKTKNELYKYLAEKLFDIFHAKAVIYKNENNSETIEFYQEKYKKNHPDNETTNCLISSFENKYKIFMYLDKETIIDEVKKLLFNSIIKLLNQQLNLLEKNIELNTIRENLISTLSHDLEVPILAERNALNYLIKKSKDENEKIFLENLLENNSQLSNTIQTLTEIYKYDANKKNLKLEYTDLNQIIKKKIEENERNFATKNIDINYSFDNKNTNIEIDKNEINKVLDIILKKILNNTNKNQTLIISSLLKQDRISYSFLIKENIINKNILETNNLASNIGENLSIYLSKIIINKHKGNLYIENGILYLDFIF